MAAASSSSTATRQGGGLAQVQSTITPTITQQLPQEPVLRLRGINPGEERKGEDEEPVQQSGGSDRQVQWAEDVVDNEGLGRKKSKVCCIYHAPRPIDESSDESSSDSSSEGSDSGDDGAARPSRNNGKKRHCDHGDHDHGRDHGHGEANGKGKERRKSPNAYERQPKPKARDGGPSGKA